MHVQRTGYVSVPCDHIVGDALVPASPVARARAASTPG